MTDPNNTDSSSIAEQHERLLGFPERFKTELSKVIVGQEDVVDLMMVALFCKGHVLLTGVPGLAKTLLVESIATLFHLDFNRIQCTPDLMPSDITGVEIIEEQTSGERQFRFIQGPLFTNLLLADEINRTSPRTQAALLQAMQEKKVTISGKTHELSAPFIVFATRNPIDSEGTYPLPEAQLDRFLFNLELKYPPTADEVKIAARETQASPEALSPIFEASELIEFQKMIHHFPIPPHLVEWIVHFVKATRPAESDNDAVKQYVEWGAGVRASQNIVHAAKAKALLEGHDMVALDDIRHVLPPILRHRIIMNFVAQAENWDSDRIIQSLLEQFELNPSA